MTNKGGRPTDYTEELADHICALLSEGNSLRKICRMDEMPCLQTIYTWFRKHDGFVEQYARAKDNSADADADRLDEIAEKVLEGEYEPQAARVAADIIKWAASKKKPKKYGNVVGVDLKTDEFTKDKLDAVEALLLENGIDITKI